MAKLPVLLEWMRLEGRDRYGEVVLESEVYDLLGIEVPEVGTKEEFQAIALEVLGAVDRTRAVLLREGKYLQGTKGNYRVLLPSENAAQAAAYVREAENKLKRGRLLIDNTPRQLKDDHVSAARRENRIANAERAAEEARDQAALLGRRKSKKKKRDSPGDGENNVLTP